MGHVDAFDNAGRAPAVSIDVQVMSLSPSQSALARLVFELPTRLGSPGEVRSFMVDPAATKGLRDLLNKVIELQDAHEEERKRLY